MHKIEGLHQAINFANELIIEDGVPIQDYRIHQFNIKKQRKYMSKRKYELKEKIK